MQLPGQIAHDRQHSAVDIVLRNSWRYILRECGSHDSAPSGARFAHEACGDSSSGDTFEMPLVAHVYAQRCRLRAPGLCGPPPRPAARPNPYAQLIVNETGGLSLVQALEFKTRLKHCRPEVIGNDLIEFGRR
jgi:hypothetical protein